MIARLWSSCVLGHGQRLHTRIDGVLSYRCERCHAVLGPVLAGEMITTPLAQVVAGAPLTRVEVQRRVRQNIAPWKVSTR